MEPLSPSFRPALWDFKVAETPEQHQVLRDAIAYLKNSQNIRNDAPYAQELYNRLQETTVNDGQEGAEISKARAVIKKIYQDAMFSNPQTVSSSAAAAAAALSPIDTDLPSFEHLPDEVVLQIIMDLPLKQIGRLRQTNKRLYAIGGEALALKISQENIPLSDLGFKSPAQIKGFLNSLGQDSCKKIQNLNLKDISIDIEFLKELSQLTPNLKNLDLSNYRQITDAWLQHIARFQQLQTLDLTQCRLITDAGLGHLADLRELQNLNLSDCSKLTDVGLKLLTTSFRKLRRLDLSGCNKITDAGLLGIASLTLLQSLCLNGCEQVTGAGLEHFANTLKELQNIEFNGCDQLNDDGLKFLARLTWLKSLDIGACWNITDTGLGYIAASLKELQSLGLGGCSQITDTGLGYIAASLKDLRSINVYMCRITKGSLNNLQRDLPGIQIING